MSAKPQNKVIEMRDIIRQMEERDEPESTASIGLVWPKQDRTSHRSFLEHFLDQVIREREEALRRFQASQVEIEKLRQALIAQVREAPAREVSVEDAKKEILALIKSREDAYPSDVADILSLDYSFVLRVMRELEKEGRLQQVG